MRVHLCAVLLVLYFCLFFKPSRMEFVILLLCFGLVIGAEAANTAVESLADRLHPDIHPAIRLAKDAAAGAVLIAAITSVLVGLCLFVWTDRFLPALYSMMTMPTGWIGLLCLMLLSVIVVFVIPIPQNEMKQENRGTNGTE